MRKVIIRQKTHVAPFNEPAHALRIHNQTLAAHQSALLDAYTDEESVVDNFDTIPADTVETVVFADNLYFDEAFIRQFIEESRERSRPTRAAFRANDPAFLQQGLRTLTQSTEKRGDIFDLDLWYFPMGLARAPSASQTEPVIIESGSERFTYYRSLGYSPTGQDDLTWWVPKRAALPIDTWVHLLFAGVVYGVTQEAVHGKGGADAGSRLRAMIERRPFRTRNANVTTGEDCFIHPSTSFSGRVAIGDNVTIGPGCVISDCIIGDNVTLVHGNHFYMCVLSDNGFFPGGASATYSLFMENTTVGQSASIEMSVIGRNTYIGPGTIFSNSNLLPGPMELVFDYEPYNVEIPVLGGCVGHNCRVGSGLVVYPGRTIESDVVLFPSPTRRVIMRDISYEESDHHASPSAGQHPRQYPREY